MSLGRQHAAKEMQGQLQTTPKATVFHWPVYQWWGDTHNPD